MPRYHVHRSIEIGVSPEKVYEAVADFGTWQTWSPWLCAEPDARVTVSDDRSSVGSLYSWEGEIVGEGEIEHRHLQVGRLIEDEIRFVKPFRSKSQVSFELEPTGAGAKITWHMRGSLPWFMFWMRSQMEVFIGMDYERGLKMLKEWIETGQLFTTTKIHGVESVGPLRMAGVRKTCTLANIGPSMEGAFAEAAEKLGELIAGRRPISVYHKFDVKAQTFDYTSGYLLPDSADRTPAGLSTWSIPATRALRVEHMGSYDYLGNAWSAGNQFARYKKLKLSSEAGCEIYANDPKDTPPSELRTDVFLLLR